MIVPKSVINKIQRVEFSLYEPASTTVLWAYPVGQSYDYRLFLAGQWTSVSEGGDASLLELIQRAELAIKAAVAATEGAEAVNAALTGNVLTITDREGNTTSLDLSEIGGGGGYEPPVGGIPKTDLASDVQTSLGKADTALQSFTESDPTVPSWAKQSSKPSYSYSEITNTPTDLAHIGDTQGSATIANFDPETDTVHITAQVLSSAAQAQARSNIGAGTSNFSGSYNDLTNKPTIPDAVSGTNDGTNWTSITIGGTTKAIPSGGGGGGGEANVIESISINGTTQTVTSKNVDLPVPVSSVVEQIVSISQSAYDALSTKDSSTLYLITS